MKADDYRKYVDNFLAEPKELVGATDPVSWGDGRSSNDGCVRLKLPLEIGGEQHRVEIELPVEHPAGNRSRIAFRPRRWRVFQGNGAAASA